MPEHPRRCPGTRRGSPRAGTADRPGSARTPRLSSPARAATPRPRSASQPASHRPPSTPPASRSRSIRAQAGESIVNATLGALMEDDGTLAVMPSVVEALQRVPAKKAAAYAPILGDPPFLRAVIRDVFPDIGGDALASKAVAAATPGGTGALYHAITCFLEPGEALLTTNWFWGPYQTIATHTRRAVETFDMFGVDGRFDLAGFESALSRLIARQGRALVVFNFPCHNPTGYSLDEREWAGVADLVRQAGERAPVAVL